LTTRQPYTTPTGTVTFYANGVALGAASLIMGSEASFTTNPMPAGTYSITAVYSGDGNFAGSTSSSLTVVVAGNDGGGSVTAGQPFTISATVYGASGLTPTGTVTFTLIDANNNQTNLGSQTLDGKESRQNNLPNYLLARGWIS
jgi:hypothetical protein